MAFSFYMDVHVPAAIAEGLRRRGLDVLTSQDDATRRATDEQLLIRATELSRVLVSQDEDLLALAAKWQAEGWDFSGLVFAPQGGGSIGRYIEDLELVGKCGTEAEVRSQVNRIPLH